MAYSSNNQASYKQTNSFTFSFLLRKLDPTLSFLIMRQPPKIPPSPYSSLYYQCSYYKLIKACLVSQQLNNACMSPFMFHEPRNIIKLTKLFPFLFPSFNRRPSSLPRSPFLFHCLNYQPMLVLPPMHMLLLFRQITSNPTLVHSKSTFLSHFSSISRTPLICSLLLS